MDVSVITRDLSKSVQTAARFISNKAQLPILGNIVLRADTTRLSLFATNLETSMSTHIGAQTKVEGEIAIPGKVFSELLNNISGDRLDLTVIKESVHVKTEGVSAHLAAMNTADFPKVPTELPDDAVTLPQTFLSSLSKVLFATSTDDARPVLTGVYVLASKDLFTLVASDGFRLSKIALPAQSDLEESFIVPKNALIELTKIAEKDTSLTFAKKKEEAIVLFKIDDLVLTSRVIDGTYPNFNRIIPKSSKTTATLSKTDLERALALSAVFARDNGNVVRLSVHDGVLTLYAESQKTGTQESTVDAQIEGHDVEVSFNYRFIEDFLHICGSDTLKIKMNDSGSASVWEDPSDPQFLHLIMPVRA